MPHFAMDEVTHNYIFRGHKRHKYKVLLKFVDLRRRQLRVAGANQSSQGQHRTRRRGVPVSQRCVRHAARADGRGRGNRLAGGIPRLEQYATRGTYRDAHRRVGVSVATLPGAVFRCRDGFALYFRYYDLDAGRFISQNPPGLAGGIKL